MSQQQFNEYGAVMCQEEIDAADAEHKRWVASLNQPKPVLSDDPIWDRVSEMAAS